MKTIYLASRAFLASLLVIDISPQTIFRKDKSSAPANIVILYSLRSLTTWLGENAGEERRAKDEGGLGTGCGPMMP